MAKKMSTKKKASAAVAGVLAVALAVGGAYAWTDYSQSARNTFKGTVAADVLLHDDFDGENKDVYVENTGDNEVYVRVKFAEYLQIGNNSVLDAYVEPVADTEGDAGTTDTTTEKAKAQPDDVTTWPVHQFAATGVVPDFQVGDITITNSDCGLDSHDYFKWNMTGAMKAYLAGVTEASGNGYGGLSEEAFNALGFDADVTIGDITTQKKNTLAASAVMMLSTWLNDENARPDNPCWLLDTDGWAYWSAALQPGTATNLLLDSVVGTDLAPHDNWVYNIDVQLQAATVNEMDYWYADGVAEVADPDNTVATVTEDGLKFVIEKAGAYITSADGTVMGADSKRYISVANNVYANAVPNATNTGFVADEARILAGQDGIVGNEDDNRLSGREGGIEVANINIETMTYGITGADAKYVVSAGIDGKLGTYDDTITSSTDNSLGTYDIDNDESTVDKVTWLYLGGPVEKMFVVTEYVHDNVQYSTEKITNTADSTTAYVYKDSALATEMSNLYNDFGMAQNVVVPVTLEMGKEEHTGNYVHLCSEGNDPDHTHNYSTNCANNAFTTYYTTADNEGEQEDIADTKFFALSLREVLTAFGDGTDADLNQLRAGPLSESGTSDGNGVYQNFKDGNNNTYKTTHYWLRSPGYTGTRAARVGYNGGVNAHTVVTNVACGARPACYMDLSGTTPAS